MSYDIISEVKQVVKPERMLGVYDFLFGKFLKLLEPSLNAALGPIQNRVMSFGPYPDGGKVVVEEVASMIAQMGLVGMTADAYYLPKDPKTRLPLKDILEAFMETEKEVPSSVYFQHLPRLASRAVFYENDERGQAVELQGCSRFKIPYLGYIVNPLTYLKDQRNSTFLVQMEGYTECKAYHRSLCGHQKDGYFCPFYDSISIPQTSLELFLEPDKTIVAVDSLEKLMNPLKLFLKYGVDKPTTAKK